MLRCGHTHTVRSVAPVWQGAWQSIDGLNGSARKLCGVSAREPGPVLLSCPPLQVLTKANILPKQLRAPGQYAGLRNGGATCYMNSVFQQLFMQPGIRARILGSAEVGRRAGLGAGAWRSHRIAGSASAAPPPGCRPA